MSAQRLLFGDEIVLPIVFGDKVMFPTEVEMRHPEPIELRGYFGGPSIIKPAISGTIAFEENAFYQTFGESDDEGRAVKAIQILMRLVRLNVDHMQSCVKNGQEMPMTDEHIKLRRLADSFIQAANMTIEKAREQRENGFQVGDLVTNGELYLLLDSVETIETEGYDGWHRIEGFGGYLTDDQGVIHPSAFKTGFAKDQASLFRIVRRGLPIPNIRDLLEIRHNK